MAGTRQVLTYRVNGNNYVLKIPTKRKRVNGVSIGTIATVWTPATGKVIRLLGGSISPSASVSIVFEDNAAGDGNFVWQTPKLIANAPYFFDLGGEGHLLTDENHVLKATASGVAAITGTLYGCEEDGE